MNLRGESKQVQTTMHDAIFENWNGSNSRIVEGINRSAFLERYKLSSGAAAGATGSSGSTKKK